MLLFGLGVDVHPLVKGRPLILGGVHIDSELGLDGHSDADVLTHAVMDALLGAAALGDIGQHFPSNDPAYAGADSIVLLAKVLESLKARGCRPVQVDCTLLAQRPALAVHYDAMRSRLAQAMEVAPGRVSVKATTTERLGFLGRSEGIAAIALGVVEENGSPD